jgi:hypothetical protein
MELQPDKAGDKGKERNTPDSSAQAVQPQPSGGVLRSPVAPVGERAAEPVVDLGEPAVKLSVGTLSA